MEMAALNLDEEVITKYIILPKATQDLRFIQRKDKNLYHVKYSTNPPFYMLLTQQITPIKLTGKFFVINFKQDLCLL